MSDFRILISCPLIHGSLDEFDDRFTAQDIDYDVPEIDQHLTEAELLDVIHQYDGVLAGDDEFTRRVFERSDRLKVISKWGIGTDSIDEEAAEDHGVAVYNTPGAFADEVADVVIGYSIMLTRRLHDIDRAVRRGEWACPRGVSLSGKTFGIVGVGNIGSAVARRTHALGMDLLGYDVIEFPVELVEQTGIESVELDELLDRSMIVSLNCPLNDDTRDLIGRQELAALGEDGYLINTARGELVEEDALVEALQSGTIAGAGLDVFRTEPLPVDHPLNEFDNVILGSHNAQNTEEAVARVNDRAVENLLAGLTGG